MQDEVKNTTAPGREPVPEDATTGASGSRTQPSLRVLVLSRYGRAGASSRLRLAQFFPALQQRDIVCTLEPLIDDAMLADRYARGAYRKRQLLSAYLRRWRAMRRRSDFDLVLVEKEALPWLPASLELALLSGIPYAIDMDDAVFHGYDMHESWVVRRLLGRRLDRLMAHSRLVLAGNRYLGARARLAGARTIALIPTVVDLARYPAHVPLGPVQDLRIVWIGSPSTVRYLQAVAPALRELARDHRFRLRVIGAPFQWPGLDVEQVAWSEESEVEAIRGCQIGIMPLPDTPWEQGKCGYKLIQYMACGLPVVASPVGANRQIVVGGSSGLFATTPEEWTSALATLLADRGMRGRMGRNGRNRVEENFSMQAHGVELARLLRAAGTS